MKIFSDKTNYEDAHRYFLNDITKSLWSPRAKESENPSYTGWLKHYKYEPDIRETDICLLTYNWNYYVDRDLLCQAEEEIENARRYHKKVVVFSGGDHPANINHSDVILFESGGYSTTKDWLTIRVILSS